MWTCWSWEVYGIAGPASWSHHVLNPIVFSSGYDIQKAMERSTILNGKTHYFDWAIFNSYVTDYQRVSIPNETVGKNNPLSSHIKNTCVVRSVYGGLPLKPFWYITSLIPWTCILNGFSREFWTHIGWSIPRNRNRNGAVMDPAPSCNLGSISLGTDPIPLSGEKTMEIFGKDSKGTHQRLLQDSWISDPNIS